MLELYQMPISHFCEKVRWALDFKGLEARRRNLMPGFHVSTAKKLAPRTTLPILVHDGNAIQNSSDIITYLDATFPDHPLTPSDEILREEALAWERLVDEEIGPHLRRLCYHYLLEHPGVVIPMLATGVPWYGAWLLRLMYPKLKRKMRALMKINAGTAAASAETTLAAVTRLNERLADRQYLVGDTFTRADLAAAALLAPIHRPPGYGIAWPETSPPDYAQATAELIAQTPWVNDLYANHR